MDSKCKENGYGRNEMVKKNEALLIKSILKQTSKRTNERMSEASERANNEGTGGNGKRIRLNALSNVY